ncbi:MAG: hypothetical protein WD534_01520 [Phycisphaeraceae bacterium]
MPIRPAALALFAALLAGCVATEIKDTTRMANVRTTIEPAEVEGLEYLESTVAEYSHNYRAQAVLAIIANRYADAGYTDMVILVEMERQPPTTRTRQLTGTEREQGHVDGKSYDREWEGPTGIVTETVPGDWFVRERVYRAEQRMGLPVME